MKLLKSTLILLSVVSLCLPAHAQQYRSEYNESLKHFLTNSKILSPKRSLNEYIKGMGPLLNAKIKEDLKSEIGPKLKQKAPRIQVSALPWVGFDIISDGRMDRLEFVGSNSVFMKLNNQSISWEQAREWSELKSRLQEILENEKSTSFSLWSLFIPEARANSLARPLIYGAAAVLTAGVFGYFLFKAADRVSKSKTEHQVEVTGIPDEFKTEHELNGIPSQFDFNTDHDFSMNLGGSTNLKELVGLRQSPSESLTPPTLEAVRLPSQAVR